MNLIRSILSASLLVAAGGLINPAMHAESPRAVRTRLAVPTRLAGGELETEDSRYDYWFRSRFSHVQLVTDGIAFAEHDDSLALTEEGDPIQADDQENPSRQQAGDESIAEAVESPAGEIDLELEGSDQAISDQDQASDEQKRKRRERITAGIGELKKPATKIRIRTDAGGAVPENRAEQFSHHQSVISIGALGIASPPPNRYTICFTHRPLYYEQRNLERCGRSCGCLQTGVSAATFLWNTAILPYQVGRQHCDCLVTSGGDCKTCQSYPNDCKLLPCDGHGLTVQAAALAGFTFLLL